MHRQCLLCGRHCSFKNINLFNLYNNSLGKILFFTEETETREAIKLKTHNAYVVEPGDRIQAWRFNYDILFFLTSKILLILKTKYLQEECKANSHYAEIHPIAGYIRVRIHCHNFLKILERMKIYSKICTRTTYLNQ